MKITFSILWFDDDEEYLESVDVEALNEVISSWGFTPNIVMVSEPDDFMSHAPFKEFDVIAVDYNLEAFDGQGEDFIKKLRQHDVYTEVIFYSANKSSDLWDAVREKELEGVFVASRTGGGEITKILKVAEQSVHKFLDLNNVRGLVMAEVGNIDEQLENIACKYFDKLSSDEKKEVIKNYVDKIITQSEGNNNKLKDLIGGSDIVALLKYLDSAKKWNICQSISKLSNELDVNSIGNYQGDILTPRNFMAHGIPKTLDGGGLEFEFFGKKFIFNDKESINIRNNLKHYTQNFNEIILS